MKHGTFDLSHYGRINLLRLAKALGEDWKGRLDFLKQEEVEATYLSRTPEISTTQIRHNLKCYNK